MFLVPVVRGRDLENTQSTGLAKLKEFNPRPVVGLCELLHDIKPGIEQQHQAAVRRFIRVVRAARLPLPHLAITQEARYQRRPQSSNDRNGRLYRLSRGINS